MDGFLRIREPLRRVVTLCLVVAGLAPVTARAGTVIEVKTVYFGEKRPDEKATIYLDVGRVRFDAIEDERPTMLVFRLGDDRQPLCWVIDAQSKTYDEFTRERVEKMRADADRARRQFEEQTSSSPPDRREQLKKTLEEQGQSIPAPPAKAEYKKVASGVKLGKWTCAQYEAYVNGQKQEDLWTASEDQLGLRAWDIEVLREMGVFFSRFSAETNAFFQVGRTGEGGFEGFPVLVVEYENGVKRERSEVTSVREEKLNSGVFELPPGARKRVHSGRH